MKIAILTNMMDFNPGYSLTGIIYDQTVMLHRYGNEVHLFVNEQFNPTGYDFSHVTVHQKIPFAHLIDYQSINELSDDHKKTVSDTAAMLIRELTALDIDTVFTHDFVFTGWFMPYGLGCIKASNDQKLASIIWMHWIHSVPTTSRDWWTAHRWGLKHRIIYPNESDRLIVAEQFRATLDHVRIIPHIKDLRTFADFSEDTLKICNIMPNIMGSDIMQVLPAGTDRLNAKGIAAVISIFGYLKKLGPKVCLLIANQWATGRQRKETLDPYIELAKKEGLEPGVDFAFTSDLAKEWGNGIPKAMLRELFMCSNLFIFPTREESFGLVVPEASLVGGCLMVLNSSLDQQVEISRQNALYFDFGSFRRDFKYIGNDIGDYYRDIAIIILGRIRQNEAIKIKSWFKTRYNMDFLYLTRYLPTIMELSGALRTTPEIPTGGTKPSGLKLVKPQNNGS